MTQLFSDMFGTIIDNTPYMKAIGAYYAGASEDGVTMVLPWREDLVGDPETRVIASGVVTALLDKLLRYGGMGQDQRIQTRRHARPAYRLYAPGPARP
jgi:acyl-coenzyme A thioesterase PaaI-like protein